MLERINIISQDIDGCLNLEHTVLPLRLKSSGNTRLEEAGVIRDFLPAELKKIKELCDILVSMKLKQFFFNTGRSIECTLFMAREFQKHLPKEMFRYIICECGGVFYDLHENRRVEVLDLLKHTPSLEHLKVVYENEFKKMDRVKEWINKENGEKEINEYLTRYFKLESSKENFYTSSFDFNFNLHHKKGLDKDEIIATLQKFFAEKNWGKRFNMVYYKSDFGVDISSYISKGMGLEVLLAYLKLSKEEVMHIGDAGNDVSAMSYVRYAGAPENAVDAVRIICAFKGMIAEGVASKGIEHIYRKINEKKTSNNH